MEGGAVVHFIWHFLDEQQVNSCWELSESFLRELVAFCVEQIVRSTFVLGDTPDLVVGCPQVEPLPVDNYLFFKGRKKFVLDSSL